MVTFQRYTVADLVGMKLNRCPICHYSLRGLPKEHRCPECGFEYDQDTSVFYPNWKPEFILMVACVVIGVAIWAYNGSLGIYGTVAMVITPLAAYQIWHLRRYRVVFSTSGIRIVDPGDELKVYEWSRLKHASWSRLTGRISLETVDGKEAFVFGRQFFGSHRRSREFVAALNRRLGGWHGPRA